MPWGRKLLFLAKFYPLWPLYLTVRWLAYKVIGYNPTLHRFERSAR